MDRRGWGSGLGGVDMRVRRKVLELFCGVERSGQRAAGSGREVCGRRRLAGQRGVCCVVGGGGSGDDCVRQLRQRQC